MTTTQATLLTIFMLSASNVFMTIAWYAHLRDLSARPWIIAALLSWGHRVLRHANRKMTFAIGSAILLHP